MSGLLLVEVEVFFLVRRHPFAVEDFAVLKGPLESGRQSPSSLGFTMILATFLQILVFYLTYYVAGETTIYPNVESIRTIHFWITAALVLLSALYAIPAIYNRSQRVQYLLSILTVQNVGAACMYLIALFLIGDEMDSTVDSLIFFTKVTLTIGVLIFIVTCIRFYILLKKGAYRAGSEKERTREKFETKSYLPMIIVGSTGLVFVIQYVVRTFNWSDFEMMLVVVIGFTIFFTMLFVLPEQLVILYCKYRFKSFNFDGNGYLKSEEKN